MKELLLAHKSTNDRGALATMCGRNEEPRPNATTHWKIAMTCAHFKTMDMHY